MSAVLSEAIDEFVQVTPEHLPAIYEIEKIAYKFPWTQGLLADCLKPNYHFHAMFREHEVIAYGVMSCICNEAHILNLCVNPKYQRQGLGMQMLNFFLDKAKDEESHTVFLEVRKSNQAAQSLYEGCGFNCLDERKGYYPDMNGREDAIIYAKALPE